jgi:hypothetical protein
VTLDAGGQGRKARGVQIRRYGSNCYLSGFSKVEPPEAFASFLFE